MNIARHTESISQTSSDEGFTDAGRARELGAFLRTRRESLDPKRLGMPGAGRRRTPGLRRDDVALLADISVTWYTRLEQGRPIRVSIKVLSAVAAALQYNEAETRHLFTLAGLDQKASAGQTAICEHLTTSSQAILDSLNPFPAVIQNARFSIIGFNRAYCRLLGVDIAALPKEDRNCLYLSLTNPTWRARLMDREDAIPRMVATFRAAMAEHMNEPLWQQQLQRYCDISEDFRQIWQRYEVRGIENQIKQFRLPRLGLVKLHQTNWWSAPRNGDRLLVYVPADERSKQCLTLLAEEAGKAGQTDNIEAFPGGRKILQLGATK
jgi:transcriptional regulator with XRE-family HTH domain